MQTEAPLTLILSPLRAGRGELECTFLGSLFGDPDTVPPEVPLSLSERERVRVRVCLDCMDTAKIRQLFVSSALPERLRLLRRLLSLRPWLFPSASSAPLSVRCSA